jgi:hypothetical protein
MYDSEIYSRIQEFKDTIPHVCLFSDAWLIVCRGELDLFILYVTVPAAHLPGIPGLTG